MVPELRSGTKNYICRDVPPILERVSAAIARGKRPVPFRTRKLSLSASMVLQGGPCGRVDRRRTSFIKSLVLVLISISAKPGAFFYAQIQLPTAQIFLNFSLVLCRDYSSVKNEDAPIAMNNVHLLGRVSSLAISKQLPSGDRVVEFRLVIDRKPKRAVKREVDTLDITAWLAFPQRRALALKINDWVEVEGSIHRRFWKSTSGLASRWQVEASQLRKI